MSKASCFIKYPGGKSRLTKQILDKLPTSNRFYDVFTGGGSISLAYAQQYPNATIIMNDLDKYIYSMWDIIVNGREKELEELFHMIEQIPTIDLFKYNRERQKEQLDEVELAYQSIFFHKTTFSGMFNAGPIGGMSQSSKWKINCHYTPKNIISKIRNARKILGGRTKVTNLDFRDMIYLKGSTLYFDPPYVNVGNKLYPIFFTENDHEDLSNLLHSLDNWVLSYNDHPMIRKLYSNHKITELDHTVSMSSFNQSGKCSTKKELLITNPMKRDFIWEEVNKLKGHVFDFPDVSMLSDIITFSSNVSKTKTNVFTKQHYLPRLITQHSQGKIAEYVVWNALQSLGCYGFSLTSGPSWIDLILGQYNLHIKSVGFESILSYGESYTFQCNEETGRVDPLFYRPNSTKDIIVCCIVDKVNKKVLVSHIFLWRDISSLPNIDRMKDLPSTWNDKKFLHIDDLKKDPKYFYLF